MHTKISIVCVALSLLHTTLSQPTMPAVSQISDGQPQAPVSTHSYENPFTIYTTQTDSLGVITGMPSVVTSQPAVVTSQPISPTLPTLSGFWYGNSTTTSSTAAPTTLGTSTTAESTGSNGSATASATFAQLTGGAVANKVAGAGVGLVVMGLGFSLL